MKITTTGRAEILAGLDHNEARRYLALEEEALALLGEGCGLELRLAPLQEYVEYRIPGYGPVESDYDEALYSLEGVDRIAYLDLLDWAARIVAREVRRWDTEDVGRLVELLTLLDGITDRADRRAEDYVQMDALPSAPVPRGVGMTPVWAVDRRGMALVGPGADEIECVGVVS